MSQTQSIAEPSRRSLAASEARYAVEMEPGFVYFAIIPYTCVLKIGFSRDPGSRVKKVAADYHATGLKLVGQMPGRIRHERKIHDAMSHYRMWLNRRRRGEFYYNTETTIGFYRALIERQGVEDWTGKQWAEIRQWLRDAARYERANHGDAFAAHKALLSSIPSFLERTPPFLRRARA